MSITEGIVTVALFDQLRVVLPSRLGQRLSKASRGRRFDLSLLQIQENSGQYLRGNVTSVVDGSIVADEVLDDHSLLQLRIVLIDVQHDYAEGKSVGCITILQIDVVGLAFVVLQVLAEVDFSERLHHSVDLLCLSRQAEGLHDAAQGLVQIGSSHVEGIHEEREDILRIVLGLPEKLTQRRVWHCMVQASEDPREFLRPFLVAELCLRVREELRW
mmetsp:Transcript_46893/g.100990  ORF Transcript_46893/g.100990 Transcript_46893/m.100990 type:complete len:216 (-) Transcript_46893:99-746(-)